MEKEVEEQWGLLIKKNVDVVLIGMQLIDIRKWKKRLWTNNR